MWIVVHTSFRQFIKMTACYPWVVDLTWWRSRARPKKNIWLRQHDQYVFVFYLNYGPREYIIFPVFLSLYLCTEKVKVQSRTKGVYFLSFFFFFIYIYTGILLKEIRIEFFSILCYFILLKSIRNFVFINLDIFFTSVQKWFLHIQFLSKLMILSNTIFARIYWILFFPKMFECCLKIDSSYVYSGSLLKALAS